MTDKIPEWITKRIERAEQKIEDQKRQKMFDDILFLQFRVEELTGELIEKN